MAFMAVLESDLRALSAEARRRYPAVKDGAEHAILKLRTLSSPSEIAHNDDILRIFLMACEVRTVKLSVIGLSCLQKLISHDAVSPSALREILSTLKDDTMSQALGICLRLLENTRSSDSVRNSLGHESISGRPPVMRETLTETGKLGLRLLEDLTSLAAGGSLEGETGEPSFRRLVLRSVAHIIRLYSSSLITECEVSFLFPFPSSHSAHAN
ncbi:Protein MON2 like [Glycine soja]|uniref:Protein MON2 like n=1 Tax=Glycine soja TaxID=3848 RepID=A0A0B2Q426_GLYSO|nr:Protein MON2 like [Glycine soja]